MGKESQFMGAAEPDHAYADAPVYEADQRLFQEGRKPVRGCLTALRALQFRASAQDPPHQACLIRLWTLEELVEQTSR